MLTKSPPFEYQMPTRTIFGVGSLSRLPEFVNASKGGIMVISTASMERTGVLGQVEQLLGNIPVTFFGPVSPNPTPEHIDEAVAVFRNQRCSTVVGIGGGSTLDLAKSTAILQENPHGTRAYLKRQAKIERPGAPFIAIPTTSGTGSEVTPWATIWDMSEHRKYSLEHRWMFPTTAIVDPALTATLPPHQSAVAGMDALTQAIEAYWAKQSQPISDMYALAAVKLIVDNLEEACTDGGIDARCALAQGSLLSGLAFSNTRTTICHSLPNGMS